MLDTLQNSFEFLMYNMGEMLKVIISNPMFLIPVAIFVAGAVIGLCSRLIGR